MHKMMKILKNYSLPNPCLLPTPLQSPLLPSLHVPEAVSPAILSPGKLLKSVALICLFANVSCVGKRVSFLFVCLINLMIKSVMNVSRQKSHRNR